MAELIWDEFLSGRVRDQLDGIAEGRGRELLVLVAAWHDLGKATPSFQAKNGQLGQAVRDLGLDLPGATDRVTRDPGSRWHGPSGGIIALRVLRQTDTSGLEWIVPLIVGHHGSFRGYRAADYRHEPWQEGTSATRERWLAAQDGIARLAAAAFGIEIAGWRVSTPSLGVQLGLAGLVSMADWIASSDRFPGLGADVTSVQGARSRARRAWNALGFRPGWTGLEPMDEVAFKDRFGMPPRPVQAALLDVSNYVTEPGLTIVEAPTGEGKSEAAFAAIETLAARFGFGGFVFAMPTQGTTDAMYDRTREWAALVDVNVPVSLAHGKAMANETWRDLLGRSHLSGISDDAADLDGYGMPANDYGEAPEPAAAVPSAWTLGRHRALLSQSVVSTVDQPLMAATQVKYVALRHAGLLGKVLVIDEVHSYDVFMTQYLHQLLRWCSDASVPVILMSATLPPQQRADLLNAYAQGLADDGSVRLDPGGDVTTYPRITSWNPADGLSFVSTASARSRQTILVGGLDVDDVADCTPIAEAAVSETREGGSALVILNTVRRAQEVYRLVKAAGVPVVLLHGRLTTAERASRTREIVARLGASVTGRPRLVVVATQIAEQSFDVDADILITDVAPMDLLLQRIGRLHRHTYHDAGRPTRLAEPRVVVTGVRYAVDGPPVFVRAFEFVYDRYSLLRTASLIGRVEAAWQLPHDTPVLVASAYDHESRWPAGWEEAGAQAWEAALAKSTARQDNAHLGVLTPPNAAWSDGTLALLHDRTGVEVAEDRVAVRDGEPSLEVALVVKTEPGYTTLSGRPLGVKGERCTDPDIAREVLGDTVRVRFAEPLVDSLRPLPAWSGVPLLDRVRAVELDEARSLSGLWGSLSYDEETGLTIGRNYT